MKLKIDMPTRASKCWDDPEWRTEKLRQVKSASGLDLADLGRLCGLPLNTIKHYHSGKWRQIPTNELRLMIFELTAG